MLEKLRKLTRGCGARVAAGGRFCRPLRGDDGEGLVEMAISIAVVLMLLFGVFDFSLAFYTYHYVSDAAREATRYAIVRGNRSCIQTPNLSNCDASGPAITSYLQSLDYPGIDTSQLGVTTTWNTAVKQSSGAMTWNGCGTADACKAPGNQVQVTVTYPFPLSIPFWQQTTVQLTSTSEMVISQ